MDFIQEKSALEVDEIHVGKETMEMLGLLGMADHVESVDVLDCSVRPPAGLLNGKEAPTAVNRCPNALPSTSQVLLPILQQQAATIRRPPTSRCSGKRVKEKVAKDMDATVLAIPNSTPMASVESASPQVAMDIGVKVLAVPAASPWCPPDARRNVINLLRQQSKGFELKQKILSEEIELILLPESDLGYVVTSISLNSDGSSLLLIGSHNISVLYVHEKVSEDGDTIVCRSAPIASQILPSNSDGIKVLQASWHPFSNNHFAVLTSDAVFRLFDLSSDLEKPEQEFYLQPIVPGKCQNASAIYPVEFSYGSDHLWDRFSVFILFTDGSIFVLFPVVPFGSDYSKRHIQEIYEDVNAFGLKSSNPNVVTNSHLAIAWLEATFPDLLHQSTDTSLLMSRAHPYAPVDDSLTLQGPLCRVCEENSESEGKSSSCEGKAVGFMYSSAGKDSVLVTAWGSGQLQIDALADEIQPQWNIGVPTRLNVNSHGQIRSVAMICDSNSQDPLALRSHRPSSIGSNVKSNIEAVWMGRSPPLLRLAIVDLALPKAPNDSSLSLFLDPLVPERFYCVHGGGLDMVTLHFLPFSYPEMASTPPSVHPVLTTGNSETSSSFLSGFVTIADAYGHVQLVGITCSSECFVVEMKGWKEPTPLQLDIDSNSIKDVEPSPTGMISKELIAGPDPPILPSASSLRSLTPDSIEGKSTLHHYIKVFHEYYVEYGHKVFIELKEHADYVKTEIEDKQKRLEALEQSFRSIEAKDQHINKRIDRVFKVYELLEKRIDSFKMLPAANKKPLSQAEQEFKAQLDRFADVELDALRSSIAALSARMKRFAQQSTGSAAATGMPMWQTPKGGRSHISESQMSLLKSSLERLSLLNEENNLKLRLIDQELKNKEQ